MVSQFVGSVILLKPLDQCGQMTHVSYLTNGPPTAPCTFYWTCSFTSSVIFCVTTLTFLLCDFFSCQWCRFLSCSLCVRDLSIYACHNIYEHPPPFFFFNRKAVLTLSLHYDQQMSLIILRESKGKGFSLI